MKRTRRMVKNIFVSLLDMILVGILKTIAFVIKIIVKLVIKAGKLVFSTSKDILNIGKLFEKVVDECSNNLNTSTF